MSGTRRPHQSAGPGDDDDTPWDRSGGAARPESSRPPQAVLDRLSRARPPGAPAPAPPPSPARPDPAQFWAAPALQDASPRNTGSEYLSGPDEYFDPATGWDFDAISDSQIAAVSGSSATARGASPPQPPRRPAAPAPLPPVDDSSEFAIEIEADEPEAELSVDDAVAQAQALFRENRDDDAIATLARAAVLAPTNPQLTTWMEFGERRLIARHCNGGRLDRVPNLVHPRDKLLGVVQGQQRALILAIDGSRTAGELRAGLSAMSASHFWRTLGRLVERSWVAWGDPPD